MSPHERSVILKSVNVSNRLMYLGRSDDSRQINLQRSDSMVKSLTRYLDDDYAYHVSSKRNIIHKSSYPSDYVKKSTIKT